MRLETGFRLAIRISYSTKHNVASSHVHELSRKWQIEIVGLWLLNYRVHVHVATCTCFALPSALNLVQIETAARQFAIAWSNFSLQKKNSRTSDNIDKASTILCMVYVYGLCRKIWLPDNYSSQKDYVQFTSSIVVDLLSIGSARVHWQRHCHAWLHTWLVCSCALACFYIIANLIVDCAFFLSSLNDNRNDLIMCVFSVCEWY